MAIHKEMQKLNEQMEVLKKCGLEKEAKKILPKYNELVERFQSLKEVAREQRRKSAQALIVCLIAADLATLAADQFGEIVEEVNCGMTKADNDFVKLIKKNAEDSAKHWNDVVVLLDEAGNIPLSQFYSDFSEQITDELLPNLNEKVWDIMTNTTKGRNWL